MSIPVEGTPTDVLAGRAQFAIVCGDSLEVSRRIRGSLRSGDRKAFDLSVTSPPYEAQRSYGIGFKLKGEEWVEWARARFLAQYAATRGLTAWVVEGFTRSYRWSATPALLMADLHRAGVSLRKPPAFLRIGIPGSGGPDFWRNDYEFIVSASHGRLPWSDNTACGHAPKFAPGGAMSNRTTDGSRVNAGKEISRRRSPSGKAERQSYEPPAKANPGNLIRVPVGGGHMGSKLAHENEAPFPLSLVERFVRSFCPPDGVVFDGFSGSGTTLDAAIRHGRRCIAVDERPDQCELTRRRAAEAVEFLSKSKLK